MEIESSPCPPIVCGLTPLIKSGRAHFLLTTPIIQKDRAFYHRISQRRVDPSSSSIQNPVPDYYGEKIGSVADYRRWLKDQRAFHLKRSGGAGNIAEAGKMVRSGKNTKT